MRYLLSCLMVLLLFAGCSDRIEKLDERNLYPFRLGDNDFFADEIQRDLDTINFEHFSSEYYTEKLRFLKKESLSDDYRGYETIRLTAFRSFQPHFTISLLRKNNDVFVVDKESYRDYNDTFTDTLNMMITEYVEFDSSQMKFFMVKSLEFYSRDKVHSKNLNGRTLIL